MYSNRLKKLMASAKNISSSNNKDMKDNDHTCRCVNGSRSDGLWYRGDDSKSATGRARWSRCSFFLSLSIFIFISTQLCLIVLLISISMYAHLLLYRLSYFTHFSQVNALLEKHKELRRKKSANSFRREGVTQVAGKENITQLEQQHIFLRDHRLWTAVNSPQTESCPPSDSSRRRRRTAPLSD